jgi:hypothetical protein
MSPDERATLQARLREAEAAYHELIIGAKEVSVSTGGKSVSFTQANLTSLSSYIVSLKRQLGLARAAPPIFPIF